MPQQYVYYFTDAYNKIIYVGKTGNIKNRMRQHFSDGHLPSECYKSVNRIFYAETGIGKYDNDIVETILIDKYKPLYNTEKVFSEKFEKLQLFSLPDLKWKELWIRWNPDLSIYLSHPGYQCFDFHYAKRERIDSIVSFNIQLLKQKGLYMQQALGVNSLFIDELIKICTDMKIDYSNSSIDVPLNIEEYDSAHVAFIVVASDFKHFTDILESELIYCLDNNIYAMPLFTPKCIDYCSQTSTAA